MNINEADLRQVIEGVLGALAGNGAGLTASVREEKPAAAAQLPGKDSMSFRLVETGPAEKGKSSSEVVLGLAPAFMQHQFKTITSIPHDKVIREIVAGIEEEGVTARIIRVYRTSDVAFIGLEAAKMCGSGIGIGLQSRGTTIIHQKDLPPLSNLELFPQCPILELDNYRAIGKNAAKYAKGEATAPVPTRNDQMARPKFQAIAALLHIKETESVDRHKKSAAIEIQPV